MRRYGRWAGSPNGMPEDPSRCIAKVPVGGRSPLFKQCGRKRGYGENFMLCTQHAGMKAMGKHVSIPDHEEAQVNAVVPLSE
jgi:hypothetical protein